MTVKLPSAIAAVVIATAIGFVIQDRTTVGDRLRRLELLTERIAEKLGVDTSNR